MVLQKRRPEHRNEQTFQSNKQHRLINVSRISVPPSTMPKCPFSCSSVEKAHLVWVLLQQILLKGQFNKKIYYMKKSNICKWCRINQWKLEYLVPWSLLSNSTWTPYRSCVNTKVSLISISIFLLWEEEIDMKGRQSRVFLGIQTEYSDRVRKMKHYGLAEPSHGYSRRNTEGLLLRYFS